MNQPSFLSPRCPRSLSLVPEVSIDPAFGPRARNGAVFAFKAFLHHNSNGVVALLGHVIAPPPGMEGSDSDSAEAAPSSVKLLLDTLAVATARTLDRVLPIAAADERAGGNGTAAADNLVPLAWRSARLLEALLLCGGETACELGMRITMDEDATPSPLLTWLLRTLARSAAGGASGTTSATAATQLRLVQISYGVSVLYR